MSELKELKPGSLIGCIGWWFVVVRVVGSSIFCVCDNANNSYSWVTEEVDCTLSLQEVGRWGWEAKELPEPYASRPFPYDVIVEVLTGNHDDRWG